MTFWHRFGEQLAHPRGRAGSLTGRLMRIVNRAPNRLAVGALDLQEGDDVLELGFGPGDAIARIAGELGNGTITGIDRSEMMLRQASRRNARAIREGRVSLLLGDFTRLPFEDNRFHKIIAVNTVYFWKPLQEVAAEVRRILRIGGFLVIYATDAQTMRRWKFAGPDTHRHVDAAMLHACLRAAGFRDDEISIEKVEFSAVVCGTIVTASKTGGLRVPT